MLMIFICFWFIWYIVNFFGIMVVLLLLKVVIFSKVVKDVWLVKVLKVKDVFVIVNIFGIRVILGVYVV